MRQQQIVQRALDLIALGFIGGRNFERRERRMVAARQRDRLFVLSLLPRDPAPSHQQFALYVPALCGFGARLEAAAQRADGRVWLTVFLFVVFMITREGMEMAFITGTLARQAESAALFWGALVGVALAAALAWAWSRYGHRVNLALFFQVTSIFLILFALQLCVYAFHEATEANVLPIDNQYWHIATEPYGPEGKYGTAFTYALVLIPALWLAWSAYSTRGGAPAGVRKS